jgi:hypothetical protein
LSLLILICSNIWRWVYVVIEKFPLSSCNI